MKKLYTFSDILSSEHNRLGPKLTDSELRILMSEENISASHEITVRVFIGEEIEEFLKNGWKKYKDFLHEYRTTPDPM